MANQMSNCFSPKQGQPTNPNHPEMTMNTEEKIHKQLAEHPIILYMKGVPDAPECGFSAKAVAILKATGLPYTYVNVLAAPFIREKLPSVTKWPTFPQLIINTELVGGSDIIEEMNEAGTLLPALEAAAPINRDGMSHSQIETLIKAGYPDSIVQLEGEGCDLLATVVSELFEGLSLVKQQQGVMATLQAPISSGKLHAVTIKTFTPAQWQEKLSASKQPGEGLLQIKV